MNRDEYQKELISLVSKFLHSKESTELFNKINKQDTKTIETFMLDIANEVTSQVDDIIFCDEL
jgi:hypothetical protein